MRIPAQKQRHGWRWTAALGGLTLVAGVLIVAMAVLPVARVRAAATVTTPASAVLSADTAATYTTLTGPVLTEGAAGDIGTGSLILHAPAGFQFNPAASVTVTMTGGGKVDDNGGCASPTASSAAVVAGDGSTITVYICNASSSAGALTWSGIQAKPTGSGPFGTCGAPAFPSGDITSSGTSSVAGIVFGHLREAAGAPATISTTSVPAGPFPVGSLQGPMVVCVKDQFGNPVAAATVSWAITSTPAGASCQVLLGTQSTTDAGGEASTNVILGNLAGNYVVSAWTGPTGNIGPASGVFTASGGPAAPCATSTPTPTETPTETPTVTGTPPTATPTGTPPTATPTTGGTEAVGLATGCNPVAVTWPDGTAVTTVAAAVSPTSAVVSIWKFNTATGSWLGFSPLAPPEVNDLQTVNRLDAIFICVSTSGTLTRPKI